MAEHDKDSTDRAGYLCHTCRQTFGAPVVHCSNCDHHHPLAYGECGNCRIKWPADAVAATPGVT